MGTGLVIMGIVFAVIAWVLYHTIFDVVYFDVKQGCLGEIMGSLIFGFILAGITLYFWKISVVIVIIACIIAFLCCKSAEGKVLVVVAGIILIIVIAVMGINFKKSSQENEDSTAVINQAYAMELEVENDYLA